MSLTKGKEKKPKQVAQEIDLKKAQEAIIKDMQEREAKAIEEFNAAIEEIAKKYGVSVSISQPRIEIKASA